MSCLFFAVEDNPDDIVFLARAFANSPCNVEILTSSLELVDSLNDPSRPMPDVVMVDLKLQGESGLDVVRALRRHNTTKAIPIIVLSSSKFHGDVSEAYAAGASSYVEKPLEYGDLEKTIGAIAHYWGEINTRAAAEPT